MLVYNRYMNLRPIYIQHLYTPRAVSHRSTEEKLRNPQLCFLSSLTFPRFVCTTKPPSFAFASQAARYFAFITMWHPTSTANEASPLKGSFCIYIYLSSLSTTFSRHSFSMCSVELSILFVTMNTGCLEINRQYSAKRISLMFAKMFNSISRHCPLKIYIFS